MSAGIGPVRRWLSFRRLIDVPFETCVAALDSWQRTGQDNELQFGDSLLRGPIEHDRDSGTCRIEVRLARGPLRPLLRMRLNIDCWSSSSTAVELIPCARVGPTAAYFRAGHLLLDSLIHSLGAPMSDTNKNLVRRHFEEIWNQREMAACDELMADDFSEHASAPFATTAPGKVHGPTAMRGTAEWLLGQFPDLNMRIESIVADEDMVAVRVRSTGTNSGKLNGFLPPSGKRFTSEQSHWFRIEDGKLAEHWATRDDLSSMLQLGLVTPPRLGALLRQVRSAAPYWLRGRRAHKR